MGTTISSGTSSPCFIKPIAFFDNPESGSSRTFALNDSGRTEATSPVGLTDPVQAKLSDGTSPRPRRKAPKRTPAKSTASPRPEDSPAKLRSGFSVTKSKPTFALCGLHTLACLSSRRVFRSLTNRSTTVFRAATNASALTSSRRGRSFVVLSGNLVPHRSVRVRSH